MITDILIIGGGGAAARCAIECNKSVIVAVKGLFGKSGCTVMAEGGYNAVVNPNDDFEIHFNDTMKGGAYINNPKLVEILIKNSPKELENLEKFGSLFDRNEDGTIAQRPFGGQSFNRTCYSGDSTGHEIMAGLMEYVGKKDNIKIMEDTTAIKLIVKNNVCYGALFINNITGEIFPIYAKSTVLATGGAGQLYPITSNPIQKVGDGFALAYNEGAILKDMEMVQFHPTGMVGTGILVTEAVRGEGGILYNKDKERFMKNYDPQRMELSTRDVVAKAIFNEVQEGRGINGGVYLDVSHLNPKLIEEKLETMFRQFMDIGVDIRKEPMIIAPTAHHTMGGIRINEKCETNIGGLYACGEVAGGIHGANRLGGNALADTQVFGAIAGKNACDYAENSPINHKLNNINEYTEELINNIKQEIDNLKNKDNGANKNSKDNNTNDVETVYNLIDTLKNIMWNYVSIVRTEEGLNKALNEINDLKNKIDNVKLNGIIDILRYFDLKNMIVVSELIIKSALKREESRGAHYRKDFPETIDRFKGNFVAQNNKITFIPLKE
ncbi:fumarate reductase (CoM/CoB) subunit TfrA [Methanococcus aeolicus]|uniref:Succinate dehydrogenase n=1 Tax=Methanococcus aeolicus (strain ATCC BAA-1280 / DSM 17508 / OCM 812 / Nankai-3) TaxID=419665 RepID=A6UTL3_META3|nr:fumarate reductase (CoM/CoB) subunit TfrA [Methanococcus aeolicus]ABR55835.1 Succinate dehydrogenase [Methanococcus aeolicus Nankai-3]UXM84058.1 fumarate reductase subunit A [Methanococcus aeolicus]